MPEYRPCIATEYVRKYLPSTKTLQCCAESKPEEVKHNAIFHRWSERFWTVPESPMIGGYAAGQMSQTVAVVEYEDGTVHTHLPEEIQFCDGKVQKEYCFPD